MIYKTKNLNEIEATEGDFVEYPDGGVFIVARKESAKRGLTIIPIGEVPGATEKYMKEKNK